MGAHTLAALGTASLDTMGGLVTFVKPEDLPEGASPRTWDTDFLVGSVFTRPGLSSVYTFTQTLDFTTAQVLSNVLTMTYSGTDPVVGESFVLSGFTGGAQFLNGQTITILTVNITTKQVTANFTYQNSPLFSNQTGVGASTTGEFDGPNPGGTATVSGSGPAWSNPSNILGSTAYASVTTSGSSSGTNTPTMSNQTGANPWTNPGNLTAGGATVASVTLATQSNSVTAISNVINFGVPTSATISGISIRIAGKTTGASGSSALLVQLAHNGAAIGSAFSIPLNSVLTLTNAGSSSYQWGTTLTPTIVNSLQVLVAAEQGAGSATISANQLQVTVFYVNGTSSQVIDVENFAYALSPTTGVTGFALSFKAYSSAATEVVFQLLKSGVPVGSPKVQSLNTTPTTYTIGGSEDLWGTTWISSDVNNIHWGVQVSAAGSGVTNIQNLQSTVYITPGLANFNYIKSFEQNNDQLFTLALDNSGILWQEDVTALPGTLQVAMTGVLPGSFAQSSTMNNREFIMFSDLKAGTDRPRQYDGQTFGAVSQCGPGAAPSFQASIGSVGGVITLTSFSITGNVVTFQYTGPQPSVDSVYILSVAGVSYLNGKRVIVLSSGLSPTQFEAALVHANVGSTNISGTATPSFSYSIASITQHPVYSGINPAGMIFVLSSGPGTKTPGNTVTVYYNQSHVTGPDPQLINDFNSGSALYVQITGANMTPSWPYNFNGIWQVTSVGTGKIPGDNTAINHDITYAYFTYTFTTSGAFVADPWGGSQYQETKATVTTSVPVPSLAPGTGVTITGVTPVGWNAAWTVVEALNGGSYLITNTSYNYTTHTAVYSWAFSGGTTTAPTVGNIVTIINCNNNAIFNGTFVISAVAGSTFSVGGILAPAGITSQPEATAQATEFGTKFTFDPGAVYVGTTTNVIYGNAAAGGNLYVVGDTSGAGLLPIGAGVRQAVCFFITDTGFWTPASPPITFSIASDANVLNVSNIPIGPPNVVARGIAITEAGQNGVAGANFYVIEQPVQTTFNGQIRTYTSTIITDNSSTTAQFTFTDAVLLDSTEVDVQGNNLFNLIELGSSAWCIPYASRMFYGLQLNKVQNFNNLSFDGGYLPNSQGTLLPLGWGCYPVSDEITLVASQVTGMALYVNNTTGSTQSVMGLIAQTAYQDAYKVPIIQPNTAYSVRVACSCPSNNRVGTLVIDLTDLSGGVFGSTYGSFTVPFSSLSTLPQVFEGPLLSSGLFLGQVSKSLQLRVWVQNMGNNADIEIDRLEVWPTANPFLLAQVFGSYTTKPEAIDASSTGGVIDTTTENAQPVYGAFVMHNNLYLLKQSSMYYTQDNPNSEPGGWGLNEVSNKVGAIGIHAYDTGEEWAVMACRSGIYGFNGGIPEKVSLEIQELWDAINWDAGQTIVLRNDIDKQHLYCAVPLPVGTSPSGVATKTVKWLPFETYNPNPTSPNYILMCNYSGMGSFQEMIKGTQVHTTMFGSLAAVDMRRKWSIWRIATPYMAQILRQNENDLPMFVCNGIASEKIYEFDDEATSDDGRAIYSLYTTYGHVNAAKAATLPIFGFHAKRYTMLQGAVEGEGTLQIRVLQNTLDARYPYTVPNGVKLADPSQDDFFRPLNIKAQRAFLEFSTNAAGSYFLLHKTLLSGKADPWSPINPTGGMNVGITSSSQ